MVDYNKIDYSQYQSWQPIQTANGGVQYLVPGTEWVYDPFVSAQTGQVQLFRNPSKQMEAQNQAEKERADAIALAKKQANPLNQIAQLAVPLGVGLAGKYAYNNWIDPVASTSKSTVSNPGFWDGVKGVFGGAPSSASVTAATSPVAAAGATAGADGLAGGLMNYSAFAGETPALSLGVDASLGGAASAAAPTAAATPAASGFFGGIGGLGALGIGAGALVGLSQAKGVNNFIHGKPLDTKQKLALALPTFGASLLSGLWSKPSTKDLEQKRWGGLAEKGITGAQEAFLAAHDPAGDGKWKEGPGAGEEWNWETALSRAKANPSEFRGVYGNFDTFGNDWATYDPAQQDAIVSRLIQEGLYDPEKGDITISDKERARKIKDEVLSSDPATSMMKPQAAMSPAQWTVPTVATSTKPLAISPSSQPQVKTVNVAPPPPPAAAPTAQDLGRQLANRFNAKFGERG